MTSIAYSVRKVGGMGQTLGDNWLLTLNQNNGISCVLSYASPSNSQ